MTWALLEKAFGEQLAAEVACRYFVEYANHRYRFRPQYSRCGRQGRGWLAAHTWA